MLHSDLYKQVLIEPAKAGNDKLLIVSGYASHAMADRHLHELKELNLNVRIELIVGMCSYDGLSTADHLGFVNLMENRFKNSFQCSYIFRNTPVHSKLYLWFNNHNPIQSFIGSANYTQNAFFDYKREILSFCDPQDSLSYYNNILNDSILCNHIEVGNHIKFFKNKNLSFIEQNLPQINPEDFPANDIGVIGLDKITISFLDRTGNLPIRSGLNWGQRPEYNRNRNQAYIRVPARISRLGFFPTRGTHFTVLTDDNITLVCVIEQDNGKGITTPHNNALIGEYLRKRIGLGSGIFVTKEHLLNYGRTDVDFYKIDEETYLMDFSV